MNKNEIYKIYTECFPKLLANFETFFEQLGLDNNPSKILFYEDKGYAIYQKNALLLLCVRQDYRRQGIGKKLLEDVEKEIFSEYDKLILGHSTTHYLYPGVPEIPCNSAKEFFTKCGYNFTWDSFDMMLETDNNIWENVSAYDGDDFDFRYRKDDEIAAAKIAGDEISGWGDAYASSDRCLLAIEKSTGEIAGGIVIDEDNPYSLSFPNTGGFGCVGVRERYRKFGLGMKLCKEALKILTELKIKRCFIGYTGLVSWYGKLGAKPCAKYAMGEKSRI
ncbi:MAG: GNAT family N-acetyltransferase [Ruminococcus sp.]|jgi:GNAT superfamily N-acetyltransferase|nr:GNAT family N-acetyltransferase [Ruminococcus sp.]